MSALFLLLSSVLLRVVWPKLRPESHWLCPVLALALPFCAGGFHIGTCAVLSAVLMAALLESLCKTKTFRFYRNRNSIALLLLLIAFCATCLWAADRGMAPFAFPRYLPVVLYMLFLMQAPKDTRCQILELVPFCGCLMTVVSLLLVRFPAAQGTLVVNGRLAGFLQYPNTFAAFLLAGLMLQSFRSPGKRDFPMRFLLMTGIILSGSKTVFVLLMVFVILVLLIRKQKRDWLIMAAALLCSLAVGYLAEAFQLLPNANRYTEISITSNTFLARLLYFLDAFPAIGKHPFGIGYMGYPAIEGTIQTGCYYVTYIHNELLQLLLEIGWVPAGLLAWALLSAIFSKKTATDHRLLLMAVLGHCMLDFDLQFSAFWILIVSCLDFSHGKASRFSVPKVLPLAAAVLAACSLWLGTGDWLYRSGRVEACLAVTPFHTEALKTKLMACKDPAELDLIADRMLTLNPTHSLACSAKANAAFSRGDMPAMIRHKENAIQLSPYSAAEYRDYFKKLYQTMELYLQAGDGKSAEYCREKLLQIPEMMEATARNAHPLTRRIGNCNLKPLPEQYLELLNQLQP